MAKHWCPSQEPFTPASLHFGSSGGLKATIKEGEEEEEEECAPIYSLSKSSTDIVMATKHPHLRDPVWAKQDLRRSASQNTQSFPNSTTLLLRPLQQYRQQHTPTQPPAAQNIPQQKSPLGNERVERWSVFSDSMCSGGSTPETVIWKGGASRPCSLTEEILHIPDIACCVESQTPAQTPATPSPFRLSSKHTHKQPGDTRMPSPISTDTHCQTHRSLPLSSPVTSPPPLAMTPEGCRPNPFKEKESVPHERPSFYLVSHAPPHPFPSPTGIARGVEERRGSEKFPQQPQCTILRTNGVLDVKPTSIPSPDDNAQPLGVGLGSPVQQPEAEMYSPVSLPPSPPVHLAMSSLPRHTGQSGRVQGLPGLVFSFSDSQLDGYTRSCHNPTHSGVTSLMTSLPQGTRFREEGTMTSQRELVDVGVQVGSQLGWPQSTPKDPGTDINQAPPRLCHMHMGSNCYLSSPSILGSPPGSSLNLRLGFGSHSNLASPSSSVFPPDSPEEELEAVWEKTGEMGRRKSCLKAAMQWEDNRSGEHSQRRNSVKQVQWDEDGRTWDVYGATLDPEELSSAIQRHLQLKNRIVNLTREATFKNKIKSRNKSKTTTPLKQTATATTTTADIRKNTETASLPMATVHTMATVATGNEVDTTKNRQQGDKGKKDGYDSRKKEEREKRTVQRRAEEELMGVEVSTEEGDGKDCEEGGQRRGEEDEGESSWRKSGRVMRSLKRCIHSSNPND